MQRGVGDCGVAALATITEASYEDTYLATATVEPTRRGKAGLTLKQLIETASRMGIKLKKKTQVNLDEDEGILIINWQAATPQGFWGHFVVLSHGMILDPADGVVMDAEEYLERYQAKVGTLLERKG